jgi:hypothetical protein
MADFARPRLLLLTSSPRPRTSMPITGLHRPTLLIRRGTWIPALRTT